MWTLPLLFGFWKKEAFAYFEHIFDDLLPKIYWEGPMAQEWLVLKTKRILSLVMHRLWNIFTCEMPLIVKHFFLLLLCNICKTILSAEPILIFILLLLDFIVVSWSCYTAIALGGEGCVGVFVVHYICVWHTTHESLKFLGLPRVDLDLFVCI